MIKIIKENGLFFSCFLLFIICGAILLLITKQGDIILFFSENRSPITDHFFRFFTRVGEEKAYILSIILLAFYRYRFAMLIPLLAIVITIVSFISKIYFHHPRPSVYFNNLNLNDQINYVEGIHQLSGYTSFPSGHTMSGFGLFAFLAFILPKKHILGLTLFIIAFCVGLSRIYLVQHFLKDVYLGAILGVIIAISIYYFQLKFPYNPNNWVDSKLLAKRKKMKS